MFALFPIFFRSSDPYLIWFVAIEMATLALLSIFLTSLSIVISQKIQQIISIEYLALM